MLDTGPGPTQERGDQVRMVRPGEPWVARTGVEHWHGASPSEDRLQMTIHEGDVTWLEPVQDTEYLASRKSFR